MDDTTRARLIALSSGGDLYAATLARLIERATEIWRQALIANDRLAADHWEAQVIALEKVALAHVAYREGHDDGRYQNL